jgi:NAD(P)-dependent dehydrogenase (short-subunit alcohol dehydrogenase family)
MTTAKPGGLLEGKVVLVTGAGSGIGQATALLAATEGADAVIVTDRNIDGLRDTLEGIEGKGVKAAMHSGDIVDPGIGDALVGLAVARFGRLDCAINNAGITGSRTPIDSTSDEDWATTLEINLTSMFRCMRAELREMYRAGSGSIVNISSSSVFEAAPNIAPYIASKHGVIGLSRAAAVEAGPRNVRVNAICPGRTDTPLFRAMAPEGSDRWHAMRATVPLGQRYARTDEIGEAIVWLCSDRASFVTGHVLVADGARTI